MHYLLERDKPYNKLYNNWKRLPQIFHEIADISIMTTILIDLPVQKLWKPGKAKSMN